MKKVKLSSFTVMFLVFSIVFIALILIKDNKIELYEQVTIEQGDTLWALAEQYRGKMDKHDWIHTVKKQNELTTEAVVSGQTLIVPVEKNSIYLAEGYSQNDAQSIKVARENNEAK